MTAKATRAEVRPDVRWINSILAIKPLFNLARFFAHRMMEKRAARMGFDWHEEVQRLRSRTPSPNPVPARSPLAPEWDTDRAELTNPDLTYPNYYLKPFHGYDQGDLCWDAALEAEVAAYAVNARLWPDAGASGRSRLRQSYIDVMQQQLPTSPQRILDIGCGVGLTTFALQQTYPNAEITGLDLSPYFLAVARYRSRQQQLNIRWLHADAEQTGLPAASVDLVCAPIFFHELPQDVARRILAEARRLLRPGGHVAIMDINPRSEAYRKMPAFILTLLKSTEPYFDEYFAFDLEGAIAAAGFQAPRVTLNTPRHRTLIAQVRP